MNSTFLILIAGTLLLGVIFLSLVPRALKKRRFMGGFVLFLLSLLMLMTGLTVALVAAGTKGYKALTREELAATVSITPLGSQRFQARVAYPDGRDTTFALAGDELYMDARILKWKPFVNILGRHTAYRLDRIAGRYTSLRDEKVKTRTIYSLDGGMMPWDLFFLRTRCTFLAPFLDAQYGSATFAPVEGRSTVRIMVTTSGLIARIDK
jgi:hypothetical protein